MIPFDMTFSYSLSYLTSDLLLCPIIKLNKNKNLTSKIYNFKYQHGRCINKIFDCTFCSFSINFLKIFLLVVNMTLQEIKFCESR